VQTRLTVLKIFAQVVDLWLPSLVQVVVEPPLEDLFGWELAQVSNLFTFLEETVNLGAVIKVDLHRSDKANHLPNDRKNHGWILIHDTLRIDTEGLDQTLAACEELVQVLSHLVDIHVGLSVYSSDINSVLFDFVQEMQTDQTIAHRVEERIIFGVKRQSILNIITVLEFSVNASGEGADFFTSEGLNDSTLLLDLVNLLTTNVLDLFEHATLATSHFDLLHDVEELDPFDKSALVGVKSLEECLRLSLADFVVSHVLKSSLEFIDIHLTVAVLVIALES